MKTSHPRVTRRVSREIEFPVSTMKFKTFVATAALFVGIAVSTARAQITNPSFETASNWTYSENDGYGKMSGGYSTSWSSEGAQSYLLYRGTGYFGAGDWWAQIAQDNVDLTGVSSLLMDIHAVGYDYDLLEFYVDTTLMSQFPVSSGTYGGSIDSYDKLVNLSGYTGDHTLTIRLHSQVVGSWNPFDPKYYYLDNLRLVPEPATLSLLAVGAAGLLIRRRKA
jgi:hypothetical protein